MTKSELSSPYRRSISWTLPISLLGGCDRLTNGEVLLQPLIAVAREENP